MKALIAAAAVPPTGSAALALPAGRPARQADRDSADSILARGRPSLRLRYGPALASAIRRPRNRYRSSCRASVELRFSEDSAAASRRRRSA